MFKKDSRRKASNIIIDPKSQLYLSIPFLVLLISNVFLIAYISWQNAKTIAQIDPTKYELIAFYQENSVHLTNTLLFGNMIFGCLCLILWLIFSHRILGPMVPIRRHINQLIERKYDSKIILRKGDEFKYLADDLNRLTESLRNSK